MIATNSPFARPEGLSWLYDITAITCVDPPSGCNPWTNAEICSLIGGACTGAGQDACADDQFTFTFPPTLTLFGSCRPDVGPFASGLLPHCGEPVPNVTSTINFCAGEGTRCYSDSDCRCPWLKCGGLENPFIPDSSGENYCQDVGPSYQWLGYFSAGSGSGTVQSSSGFNCNGSCLRKFPRGGNIALTATPQGGSVFSGWSGDCNSVAGNICYI